MHYRQRCTQSVLQGLAANNDQILELSDYIHGTAYLQAVNNGKIGDDDTASDVWIYIWVFLNCSPDSCYKKHNVMIGGIIPGPKKPKNLDLFLYRGLHHVSAVMKEGLVIWDGVLKQQITSDIDLAFVTAQGPGIAFVSGLVGHSGRYDCRIYCPMPGRNKPGTGHYYPANLKPTDYTGGAASTHDDIKVAHILKSSAQDKIAERLVENLAKVGSSRGPTEYKKNQVQIGIAKPSILAGLSSNHILGIPASFPLDSMHHLLLNIPDLFFPLWRGTMPCEAGDNKSSWDFAVFQNLQIWRQHGAAVEATRPYLPGSFDHPPRNPAEKISSGYKAVEYGNYLYGLGPAQFYSLLPLKYWTHLCKLVCAVRLLSQHIIKSTEVVNAHKLLLEFVAEFEELYYQRKTARLHYVRQSVH
ncbi:hypothetical protein PHLCEN_2v3916 [Hermanssonia centrifuga]|uniref:Uncharacterized protein n=1 Tax=Hermanssonia centrifuga TaxID=98765 RepID=A0A2R6QB63_9APHY|nr:hypothetical protein PHLCEN_2v3916 [Hermanssonia centrifuga]